MKTSCLVIVPARKGSKRLPGKNQKLLAGRSLLEHTAEAIAGSEIDAPVLLTTDGEEIASEGRRLGWMVPFLRPAKMATDSAPTIDAIIHALDWFRSAHGSDPGVAMVLQPTSPLRGSACLREALHVLESRSDVNSVIAMSALHLPTHHIYTTNSSGFLIPAVKGNPHPAYAPNGALYATRVADLRHEKTLYAGNIWPLFLDLPQSIDIDTEEDWNLAKSYLYQCDLDRRAEDRQSRQKSDVTS